MAGAFQGGFRMGQQAWQQALDNQDREERRRREADEYGLRRQQLVLQNQAAEDAAAQRRELAGIRTQIGDFQQGFNRAGYNAAADADFDSALAASDAAVKAENAARRGLAPTPAPAYVPPTQGNLANDEATRARFTQAPDITNDDYMRNMSGLRQRYALAAGDMKGFDDMAAAERNRRTAIDDSAFARAVTTNPEGPEAKAARAYVNRNSRKLTTRVDPKTNMTTFVLAQDDGYNEVKVNPSDLARIAVGVRRLERGDVGGLDIISAVNKDLAAAVREDMKLDMDAGKGNNDAAFKSGSLKNDAERNRITADHYKDMRAKYDAANKQLDPADVKKLNDMTLAIQAETDPVKRQRLMQDFRVAQANAMSRIGRVVGLPEPKVALDIPFDKFMEIYGDQPAGQVGGKSVKLRELPPDRARAAFIQFRNGSDSLMGLPDVAAPPRAPAPAARPASSGFAYGTPEDFLSRNLPLGRSSVPASMYSAPVDFSKYATPSR